MKKLILHIILLVGAFDAFSQDPQFSQFYAAPLYLNPALTGATKGGRIAGNYRSQWPGSGANFTSGSFSFDQNIRRVNSGVGLFFINDNAGKNGLKYTGAGASYAYNVNITRFHSVRAGIRVMNYWRSIDKSGLVFGDQLINNTETSNSVGAVNQSKNYLDLAGGAMFYSKNYWIGVSVDHLTRPNLALYTVNDRLPMKYSLHAGYNYPLTISPKGDATSKITAAINYKGQKKWDQLDLGFYYTRNPIVLGLWYRGLPLKKNPDKSIAYSNRESFIFLFGVILGELRIGYSYDLTSSKLTNTGGAHEISLIYEWSSKKHSMGKNRIMVMPCAKF